MAGIYIHIPFCKQACFYCDFHFIASLRNKEAVVDALLKELRMRKGEMKSPVESIYFGGGTPSLLETREIQNLIAEVYRNFEIVPEPEITLEANPDDLNLKKIEELAATKVNRLSIGVQSFYDKDLQFMNRAHSAEEAQKALREAVRYFNNITVDLIYGIPGLTDAEWRSNLERVFQMRIPHISAYALTVENRTALAHFIRKGTYPPVDENQAAVQYHILTEMTEAAGYIAYEISNFGKEKFFSEHNTTYWQGKDYLGIGPSAHSFVQGTRSWNVANNHKYVRAINQGVLPAEKELLTVNDRFNEMIMTGLRTIWGVSLQDVASKFGVEIAKNLEKSARKFIESGLMQIENRKLIVTKKGRFLADGIASELFRV